MADKNIGSFPAVTAMGVTDLFVLEQAGVAKKLTGQLLKATLLAWLEGHGGIKSIVFNDDSTMTVTADDGTAWTSGTLKGETGPKGAQGIAGASSVLAVTAAAATTDHPNGGYRVTLTTATPQESGSPVVATEEFVVWDGRDGIDGRNGTDGVDGKDGTNGVDGKDGTDGTDGKSIQLDSSMTWNSSMGRSFQVSWGPMFVPSWKAGDVVLNPTNGQVFRVDTFSGKSATMYYQGDLTGPAGPTGATGATGATGEQGPKGDGLQIDGTAATYADLPTLTAEDKGKAYAVAADGQLYYWDGSAWPAESAGIPLKGEDGISPTVTTENTVASGLVPAVKVTITDKDGDHEFTIKDGKAGKNGTAGTHGDSVTVTVSPLSATEEHTNGGQQLTFKKTTYPSSGGSSVSTEAVELWHGNNGISSSFLDVTFTVSDSAAVSDKTVEEVYNAYLAGYQVRGKSSGEIFQLAWCEKLETDSYQIEFASLGGIGNSVAVDRISVADAAGSTTSWTSERIYA